MKILFVGGTGIISSACAQLALERGHALYLLNRGQTTKQPVPAGAQVLHGDIRDRDSIRAAYLRSQVYQQIRGTSAQTP
jgi:nucleoside-diphosphate-sugar epimerase